MQRFALIVDASVREIVEIPDDEEIADRYHPDLLFVPAGDSEVGWSWDGDELSAPPSEPAPPLPAITRRQLRLTLLAHGLLDQVEPAIQALSEPDRSVALIEWQDASEYQREHPLIGQLAAALSIAPDDIDTMWAEALAR